MRFMAVKKSRKSAGFVIYSYLKVGRSQEYKVHHHHHHHHHLLAFFYSKFINRIQQVVRRGDLKKPQGLYREATSRESSDLET